MWKRLGLEKLEQTHAKAQTHTHSWDEKGVIKMKPTGGPRKHIRHQTTWSSLWEMTLEDRIPWFSWQDANLVCNLDYCTSDEREGELGLCRKRLPQRRASLSWGRLKDNSEVEEITCYVWPNKFAFLSAFSKCGLPEFNVRKHSVRDINCLRVTVRCQFVLIETLQTNAKD